jgi:hypothetical protein
MILDAFQTSLISSCFLSLFFFSEGIPSGCGSLGDTFRESPLFVILVPLPGCKFQKFKKEHSTWCFLYLHISKSFLIYLRIIEICNVVNINHYILCYMLCANLYELGS